MKVERGRTLSRHARGWVPWVSGAWRRTEVVPVLPLRGPVFVPTGREAADDLHAGADGG